MQTKAGAIKAVEAIRLKYGEDYWKIIGAKGGKNGRTGGFGAGEKGRELARIAGAKGGSVSRRT